MTPQEPTPPTFGYVAPHQRTASSPPLTDEELARVAIPNSLDRARIVATIDALTAALASKEQRMRLEEAANTHLRVGIAALRDEYNRSESSLVAAESRVAELTADLDDEIRLNGLNFAKQAELIRDRKAAEAQNAALVEALERIDGSGNPLIARDVLARYKEGT